MSVVPPDTSSCTDGYIVSGNICTKPQHGNMQLLLIIVDNMTIHVSNRIYHIKLVKKRVFAVLDKHCNMYEQGI